MSESIEYQRGEPFRLIRVFRESSDAALKAALGLA